MLGGKTMASLEQKIAAEVLRERGKNLLKIADGEKTPKEMEAERLFFWILNRLDDEMEESDKAKKEYHLMIEEIITSNQKGNGQIIFSAGSMIVYHSKYVYGNDINDVMVRVKCTLNSIHGYSMYIVQNHSEQRKAIMSIELSV